MSITSWGWMHAETCDDLQAQIFSLQEINGALRSEIDVLRSQIPKPINEYDEDYMDAMEMPDRYEAEDYFYERGRD